MLVFGEHLRVRDPRSVVRELAFLLPDIAARPPGLARHAALVGAFIEASELTQALADAESAAVGFDGRGLISDLAMALLIELAHDIAASWASGFTEASTVPSALSALARLPLPAFARMRRAEGHALYAVYPEAYLVAAAAARTARPGPRRVIGVRCIGTGLAAMVATATEAPLPVTVRTTGDPYRRQVVVTPELAREWTDDPTATVAIVDEGPGLSGSSFGAVGDMLEQHGVTRIECFASHAGELGPFALPRHRERWRKTPRYVVDVDRLIVHTTASVHALARWVAELVGPLVAPLDDVSAGAWRERRFGEAEAWPPSVIHHERRKWLAHTAHATWLVKFVGLGRTGERALARARTLHAARLGPEIAGLCHGFLIQRWLDEAPPLDLRRYAERGHLVDQVGRYLGFRARAFPASERGASLSRLLEMARRNVTLALGARTAARLDRWESRLPNLERSVQPIEIDGRLHAWEWLTRPDDTLVKTDGLDHHAGHDLVGCQDVTWDLAGAAVELALSVPEQKRLATVVTSASGRTHDPELLALMRPCYLAFQLGWHAVAIDTVDTAEATRLRIMVDHYATLLKKLLG